MTRTKLTTRYRESCSPVWRVTPARPSCRSGSPVRLRREVSGFPLSKRVPISSTPSGWGGPRDSGAKSRHLPDAAGSDPLFRRRESSGGCRGGGRQPRSLRRDGCEGLPFDGSAGQAHRCAGRTGHRHDQSHPHRGGPGPGMPDSGSRRSHLAASSSIGSVRSRQEALIREAITNDVGVPVLGAIPRLSEEHLPSRHLGLVTSVEHPAVQEALAQGRRSSRRARGRLRPYRTGRQATELARGRMRRSQRLAPRKRCASACSGTAPSPFTTRRTSKRSKPPGPSSSRSHRWPTTSCPRWTRLYAGGGFPEVYAEELSRNRSFRESLARQDPRRASRLGGVRRADVPVPRLWSRTVPSIPWSGPLPVVVEQTRRPQGHGYVRARVDGANPFFTRRHGAYGTRVSLLEDQRPRRRFRNGSRGRARNGPRRRSRRYSLRKRRCRLHAPPRAGVPRLGGRAREGGGRGVRAVSLRARIHEAVRGGLANGELEELVENEPRAIRYLLGMSYNADPEIRKTATRGIALAARHHPKRVAEDRATSGLGHERRVGHQCSDRARGSRGDRRRTAGAPAAGGARPDPSGRGSRSSRRSGRDAENGCEPMSGQSRGAARVVP